MNVTTNAAVTGCVLLSLLVQSVCAQDAKLGPFPETISKEAKAFLIRTKGDIINNYILQDGQPVLEQSYREGEPSLQITEDTIGGVKAFWVTSKRASSDKVVVIYFHGGGYVVGDGKADGGFILPVFEELGVKGLSVDYRLAPKHPFPTAVEDAVAIYRGLLKRGYKPEQIAFTGDSAGGGLALAAVLSLKTSGDPLPAAIAVISPGFLDAKRPGDTWLTLRETDPFVGREEVEGNIKKYAGKAQLDHPLLSPIYGNYEGFPPLLIQVGTREMLLSDSVQLARKAREAHVDVTLDVWDGMWHSFHMQWPLKIPESQQACKFMADFLGKHLPLERPSVVSESRTLSTEYNKELLRRAHAEIWSKGNLELVDELYAKDYVCHFIDGIEWKSSKGLKEEVTRHRTSFPDWKEEMIHIVSEGPFVVTHFKCTGTNRGEFLGKPATGRKVAFRETAIHRIVDGKIVEQWGFPDVPTLQKQLSGPPSE